MPKISICVTSFNREDLIVKCLEAIALQSYGDFELIVVDNGSTDNSVRVIKEFFSKKYFHKE